MTRSSCRAREAAFGREAVVKSGNAFSQVNCVCRICEDFVLERSLAGSAAATDRVLVRASLSPKYC
ncbi:hypothetical protein QFZ84_005671 [Pseudomonas fluorescens]